MVLDCPLCGTKAKGVKRPFYINISGGNKDGLWNTYCCDEKGNLITLQIAVGDNPGKGLTKASPGMQEKSEGIQDAIARIRAKAAGHRDKRLPPIEAVDYWHDKLFESDKALRWLTNVRGLSIETIKKFKLGFVHPRDKLVRENEKTMKGLMGQPWIVIPFFENGELVNYKARCLAKKPAKGKKWSRWTGGKSILFNSDDLANASGEKAFICEAEFDTMAAWQMGLRPVVGSTLGAGNFPDEWKERLMKFDRLHMLHDHDEPNEKGIRKGDEGAQKAANQLGAFRCSRVPFPSNDVNDWLVEKPTQEEVDYIVQQSVPYNKVEFSSAYKMAQKLLVQDYEKAKGNSTGYADLDKKVGGVRDGEVTILMADTSIGKTTFAVNWLREQCDQGLAGMFWPLEGTATAATQKLVSQIILDDWVEVAKNNKQKLEQGISKLDNYPFFFYDMPAQDQETVRSMIHFFCRRYSGKRIVIDHFHKLVRKFVKTSGDERTVIDSWLDFFCEVAKETMTHILLIAHPRNDPDGRINFTPDLGHFKGSSAGKQDVDTVLVLQRVRTANRDSEDETSDVVPTNIIAKKVRADYGQEGKATLVFIRKAQKYVDPGNPEARKYKPPPVDNASKAAGDDDDDDDDYGFGDPE